MRVSTRTASLAAVLVSTSLVLISATRIWGKEPTGKAFGAWGVDLTSRDLRTPAGDDFFAYANGSWLAKTEIPSDQSSTSAGRDVFNLTQDQLRELIEASAAKATTPTGAQIGGLYKSFMDEAGVEAADAKPLASDLAAIQAVSSKQDFVRLMGRTATNFGSSVFGVGVYADAKKPVSSLYLGQGGLGMPDRDYYLTDGFKDKKDAYQAYVARTFSLIKDPAPDEKARAGTRIRNGNREGELGSRGSTPDRQGVQPDDR